MRYLAGGTPLVILAGKEYGTGSSRDWAAKGPALLGVKAVIAESYERIHRSNLVGMGVLRWPIEPGDTRESLGLTGRETFRSPESRAGPAPGRHGHRHGADDSGRRRFPGRGPAQLGRSSWITTGTGASCSGCCGSSPGARSESGEAVSGERGT